MSAAACAATGRSARAQAQAPAASRAKIRCIVFLPALEQQIFLKAADVAACGRPGQCGSNALTEGLAAAVPLTGIVRLSVLRPSACRVAPHSPSRALILFVPA